MKNATHEAVKEAARNYTLHQLGWYTADVAGVVEDPVTGSHFLVLLKGTCIDSEHSVPTRIEVALLLEWLGVLSSLSAMSAHPGAQGWTVIGETDAADYERNAVVARECTYCSEWVRADEMVAGVCRRCNKAGIES